MTARCTFSIKSISGIQKMELSVRSLLSLFFLPFSIFLFVLHCPSLRLVFVSLWLSACLPVLAPPLCSLALSSSLTFPFFPWSQCPCTQRHESSYDTFHTLFPIVPFELQSEEYLFSLRFPLNVPNPGMEHCTVALS